MINGVFNLKRFKEASNNLKFDKEITDQLDRLCYTLFDYLKTNREDIVNTNPILFDNPYKFKLRVIKVTIDPDPDKKNESGFKLCSYYNIDEQRITLYPRTIIKTRKFNSLSTFAKASILSDLEYYIYHEFSHVIDPKLEEGNPLAGPGTYGTYTMSETEFDADSKAACQYIKNYINFNTTHALPEVGNWLRNENLSLSFLPIRIQKVIEMWRDNSDVLYKRFRQRVFNDYEEIKARTDKELAEAKKNET